MSDLAIGRALIACTSISRFKLAIVTSNVGPNQMFENAD